MSNDLENFLGSSAEHRNSLFTRDPSVLSITMKLSMGSTNLDDSDMVLADEALKSYERARNSQHLNLHALELSHINDHSNPVTSEELDYFLCGGVATIRDSSSHFLNAAEHYKLATMDGIGKGKRTIVENATNSTLDELIPAQIRATRKYLKELIVIDGSMESIQYSRLDILATRSGITAFADSQREKFDSVGFLQEASPVL